MRPWNSTDHLPFVRAWSNEDFSRPNPTARVQSEAEGLRLLASTPENWLQEEPAALMSASFGIESWRERLAGAAAEFRALKAGRAVDEVQLALAMYQDVDDHNPNAARRAARHADFETVVMARVRKAYEDGDYQNPVGRIWSDAALSAMERSDRALSAMSLDDLSEYAATIDRHRTGAVAAESWIHRLGLMRTATADADPGEMVKLRESRIVIQLDGISRQVGPILHAKREAAVLEERAAVERRLKTRETELATALARSEAEADRLRAERSRLQSDAESAGFVLSSATCMNFATAVPRGHGSH